MAGGTSFDIRAFSGNRAGKSCLEPMITYGFGTRKRAVLEQNEPKTAHFVHKNPETLQNKAFQGKKYLTGGWEWIYLS